MLKSIDFAFFAVQMILSRCLTTTIIPRIARISFIGGRFTKEKLKLWQGSTESRLSATMSRRPNYLRVNYGGYANSMTEVFIEYSYR